MAKFQFVKATTSQTVLIFIQDSSSTTGAGLTGLVFNTASLTAYYYREAQGTGATAITLATATLGTWATGGFIVVDATNMPGVYELHIPDAALATGADFVTIVLKGATNMAQLNLEIQLTDLDMNDGVRGAMTALPNAVVDAAGGLTISDAGGLDMDALAADAARLTAARAAVLTDWINGGRLDLLLDAIVADVASLDDTKIPDTLSLVNINAEVDTALDTAISELGVGAPTATPTVRTALMLMYMALRNKLDVQTSGTDSIEIHNDAGTRIAQKLITDDGSDYSEAEMITGA